MAETPYAGVTPTGRGLFWGAPVLRRSDGELYCPGFSGETYSRNQWDYVGFGPILISPGLADVKVVKSQESDIKQAAGRDGATVTTHGVRPAEITVTLRIWTPQQLEEMYDLWAVIMPKANKNTATAFDVSHPVFTLHDIKSMIVLRGEGPVDGPAPKVKLFTITGIEFVARPKAQRSATKTLAKAEPSTLDPNATVAASAPATPGTNRRNTGP